MADLAGFYLAYQPIPQKDTVHCKISKIFIFYFYRQFRKMNTIPLVKTTMEKLFCHPCELCLLEVLDLSKEVGLCRANGCKVTSCQNWRFEKNSAILPESNYLTAALVWVPGNRIILKVWWTITLKPFDLQRLTVPLLKDLNLFCWHNL